MGIRVLSPDVNESVYEYSAVGDVVRFGLGAIRNVGKNAVDAIIAERENGHGKYVNFTDFIKRVPLEALNRRLVESLIKAGAFDSIDPNRRALFTIHETAINSVVGLKRKQAEGQFDLFADWTIPKRTIPPWETPWCRCPTWRSGTRKPSSTSNVRCLACTCPTIR